MLGIVVTTEKTMYKKDFGQPLYRAVEPVLAGYMEHVRPVYLPEPLCMLVNEEGILKKLPLNELASAWYNGIIVGNVIIMKDGYTEDGPDILGLTEEECLKVIGIISATTMGDYRLVNMEEAK